MTSPAAARRGASESARAVALVTAAVFALLALAHVWFANELPHFRQPNGWSRLYLALAIAEEGGFAVDAQVARHGRIEDLATHAGRISVQRA